MRLLLPCLVATWSFAAVHADEFPTQVRTASGVLAGATDQGVLSFKGIPYAQPPVGALALACAATGEAMVWRAPGERLWP